MAGKKGRKSQSKRTSKATHKDTAPNKNRRHLGQIIDTGALDDDERKRLDDFERKETLFFEKHLAGMDKREIKRRLYYSTLANLRKIRGDYIFAITRQGHSEADQLLRRIAADILRQDKPPERPPSKAPAPTTPGVAKTLGDGGFKNDCCQRCGGPLLTVCYSRRGASSRVPRSNKICHHCYYRMTAMQKLDYHQHKYKHGVAVHRCSSSACTEV